MNTNETYCEIFFDKSDLDLVTAIKKKDKKRLSTFILIGVIGLLILPFIPGRNGNILVEQMTYLNAILLATVVFLLILGLPIALFMNRKYKDYSYGKKIVINTSIKKIRQDKKDIWITLTNPNCKFKSIFIHRDNIYAGIELNDQISISYLPRTKYVLELKKL